jgi:putative addiction module component (TIGR02574 family)
MIQIQEILDLSVADRILMVEKIWDSINPEDIQLSNEQEQELDARLARYKKGGTTFFTWNEIKDEINKI